MDLFIELAVKQPFFFFSWVLIVCFSVCFHELSHAFTAYRLGDDTAAREGHLTMNPMVQMGTSSLIMLALVGIAWGAVPVNPLRLRGRGGEALVSFAGPAANLLLCVVFAGLSVGVGALAIAQPLIETFFRLGAAANAVLFFFNMLPIPMFDGWSVASMFVPAMRRVSPQQAQTYGWFAVVLVFVTPLGDFIWQAGYFISGTLMSLWGRLFGI